MNNSIIFYKNAENKIELQVQLEKESVWLTQAQMAKLFSRDRDTISEHLQNIFNERELIENAVTRNFRVTAADGKSYNTKHYNLDVIISVGYRVKSLSGTQFRIWATNVLRKYLVEGYVLNQKRLETQGQKYNELQAHLKTLKKVIENEEFDLDESKELVRVVTDYAQALELLEQSDHATIKMPDSARKRRAKTISYDDARKEIDRLRFELKAHSLFGNEKDGGFKSALGNILQTFDGKELYPSLEEKAAKLLYLIIKNHPFSDGNKIPRTEVRGICFALLPTVAFNPGFISRLKSGVFAFLK